MLMLDIFSIVIVGIAFSSDMDVISENEVVYNFGNSDSKVRIDVL